MFNKILDTRSVIYYGNIDDQFDKEKVNNLQIKSLFRLNKFELCEYHGDSDETNGNYDEYSFGSLGNWINYEVSKNKMRLFIGDPILYVAYRANPKELVFLDRDSDFDWDNYIFHKKLYSEIYFKTPKTMKEFMNYIELFITHIALKMREIWLDNLEEQLNIEAINSTANKDAVASEFDDLPF